MASYMYIKSENEWLGTAPRKMLLNRNYLHFLGPCVRAGLCTDWVVIFVDWYLLTTLKPSVPAPENLKLWPKTTAQ